MQPRAWTRRFARTRRSYRPIPAATRAAAYSGGVAQAVNTIHDMDPDRSQVTATGLATAASC
ncbi:MAG: hypothetical protein ACLTG4_07625 [Oscillospiraceae bacterium]